MIPEPTPEQLAGEEFEIRKREERCKRIQKMHEEKERLRLKEDSSKTEALKKQMKEQEEWLKKDYTKP